MMGELDSYSGPIPGAYSAYSGDSILNSLTPLLTHARDIGNALP